MRDGSAIVERRSLQPQPGAVHLFPLAFVAAALILPGTSQPAADPPCAYVSYDLSDASVPGPQPTPPSLKSLKLMTAAAILVPLGLFIFAAWESRVQRFREAEQLIQRTVEVLSEHATRVLETQALILDRVDERIRGMSWQEVASSENLHRDLRMIDEKLDQVDTIWIIDAQARGRASSVFFPAPASSYVPDHDYFLALKDKDSGFFIGQPYPGRSNPDRMFFNMARRRSTPDGSFDGVIVTSLQPDYFAQLYRPFMASGRDSTSILRADGTVLARGPSPLRQSSVLSPDSSFMQAIRAGDQGLYRTTSQVDGIERIYGFRKLSPYPVYVTFGHSVDAILAQWHKDLALQGFVGLAAMLALLSVSTVACAGPAMSRRSLPAGVKAKRATRRCSGSRRPDCCSPGCARMGPSCSTRSIPP
jgi:hypothetical protein